MKIVRFRFAEIDLHLLSHGWIFDRFVLAHGLAFRDAMLLTQVTNEVPNGTLADVGSIKSHPIRAAQPARLPLFSFHWRLDILARRSSIQVPVARSRSVTVDPTGNGVPAMERL